MLFLSNSIIKINKSECNSSLYFFPFLRNIGSFFLNNKNHTLSFIILFNSLIKKITNPYITSLKQWRCFLVFQNWNTRKQLRMCYNLHSVSIIKILDWKTRSKYWNIRCLTWTRFIFKKLVISIMMIGPQTLNYALKWWSNRELPKQNRFEESLITP